MTHTGRPSVDDVRAAFYAQAPQQVWIREVHLDPLELIVSDDRDGTTRRVPVHLTTDGQISFGEQKRVRVEYVLADATRLESTLVFASPAEARAGNGTHVNATTRKETGLMRQPSNRRVPGDRPRRPSEDVVGWALATGRIGPEQADYWDQQVAASAPAATHVLEALHPGCAVPLTATGRPYVHAAAMARPAGIPAHWFTANPLVDQMRQHQPLVYADAAAHGGPAPTLFGSGHLPVVTASGMDPAVLASQPWPMRHPLAAAATTAEVEDLVAAAAEMGEQFTAGEWMAHEGNVDYDLRVRAWAMRGIDAAADTRRAVEAQQQVAAATGSGVDGDVLLDDPRPAQRRLATLRSVAAGRAVGAGITQRQARAELRRLARGEATTGRYGRIAASAAQAELDALDAELGR